jgi:hypothetical protein
MNWRTAIFLGSISAFLLYLAAGDRVDITGVETGTEPISRDTLIAHDLVIPRSDNATSTATWTTNTGISVLTPCGVTLGTSAVTTAGTNYNICTTALGVK